MVFSFWRSWAWDEATSTNCLKANTRTLFWIHDQLYMLEQIFDQSTSFDRIQTILETFLCSFQIRVWIHSSKPMNGVFVWLLVFCRRSGGVFGFFIWIRSCKMACWLEWISDRRSKYKNNHCFYVVAVLVFYWIHFRCSWMRKLVSILAKNHFFRKCFYQSTRNAIMSIIRSQPCGSTFSPTTKYVGIWFEIDVLKSDTKGRNDDILPNGSGTYFVPLACIPCFGKLKEALTKTKTKTEKRVSKQTHVPSQPSQWNLLRSKLLCFII